jgi:hypothetical protein
MAGVKSKLLSHFKALQPALQELDAVAYLNLLDFRLAVRFGNTEVPMFPQFVRYRERVKQYTPEFGPDVRSFIGWLPYFNKRWDVSSEKIEFKAFALKVGLATPEYSVDPGWQAVDVLVKKSRSSFGLTIRGPFRRSGEHRLDVDGGEYFERYVPGRIVKIWYWNARPVCLEMEEHARLTGDGVSSIKSLAGLRLDQMGRGKRKNSIPLCADFLAYQGLALDSVPATGQDIAVDYRYGSALAHVDALTDVDLRQEQPPEIGGQLKRIGEVLVGAIPAELRPNSLFTVDAVLDRGNKLWLLEMNSNPFVHPFAYPPILASLAERVQQFRAGQPSAPTDARVPDTVH